MKKSKTVKIKDDGGFVGKLVIKTYRDGKLVRQSPVMYNKVVSGSGGYGRNLVIRQLAGDTTYGIAIGSAGIGTGTTAPVDADTGLETVVVQDVAISNVAVSNDEVVVDVFMSNAVLANGSYTEFGLFISTGGSRRLFSRVIISPTYTKAAGEDSTFSYTIGLTG